MRYEAISNGLIVKITKIKAITNLREKLSIQFGVYLCVWEGLDVVIIVVDIVSFIYLRTNRNQFTHIDQQ